jgi:hypothetical protein
MRSLLTKLMSKKKTPAPAPEAPQPPEVTKPVVSKMEIHRQQAPADVKAAYALVAEYERRCP